jgi:LmbE family N-acetylglucosaminyl deacetylase
MGIQGVNNYDGWSFKRCAVIVAHPDDETIWGGGTILSNDAEWQIISLTRRSDVGRAPKFFKALSAYGATGEMGDLDDGVEQRGLAISEVTSTIMNLLDSSRFDLIITHSPLGEYSRHLRHEEVGWAVTSLLAEGTLRCGELWMFAYSADEAGGISRCRAEADLKFKLGEEIWEKKLEIISGIYGFCRDSFEFKSCQRVESFWCFREASEVYEKFKGIVNESPGSI